MCVNIKWPLDREDFKTEISLIQLGELRHTAFSDGLTFALEYMSSQRPLSCDETRK